jgi:DinB family protein
VRQAWFGANNHASFGTRGESQPAEGRAEARPESSRGKEALMPNDAVLREHLISLLTEGNAHATFDAAVKNLPEELRGKRPKGAEHSPWQILEHLRIAQWDILEFSRDAQHKSPKWPEEYWPKRPAPPDEKAWDKSVRAFRKDLKALCALVADEKTDLFGKIPHGDGQTILREALLTADHNAYHVGQLVLVRKLLGAWK